ncbi:hypothetical protein BV22DRAFT_1036808 [Leucogyrophana mollusca]|uniref:Uncharacterized protein n=1 Tax=Leucogyrophana mollusca TaxID=85980 RepID=A0ACB8BC37_9AGAM|nr:hypothetical protein BV22DRAFT_1036808 [Leucogyrophana mollusca]
MEEILPSRQNTRGMYSTLDVADDKVDRRVANRKCVVTRGGTVCQGLLTRRTGAILVGRLGSLKDGSHLHLMSHLMRVRTLVIRLLLVPPRWRNWHSTVVGGELRWGRLPWTMPGQMVALTTTAA